MNNETEGTKLSITEIAALYALHGKRTLLGFDGEVKKLSQQELLDACCRLMADNLLLWDGEKYKLNHMLQEQVTPMLEARTVLVMTPACDGKPQKLFYLANNISTLERTAYGGYVLRCLERQQLMETLIEAGGIRFSEEILPNPVTKEIYQGASWEELMCGASFMLELLNGQTGIRLGWARGLEVGPERWLEWSYRGKLLRESLTKAGFSIMMAELMKGAI